MLRFLVACMLPIVLAVPVHAAHPQSIQVMQMQAMHAHARQMQAMMMHAMQMRAMQMQGMQASGLSTSYGASATPNVNAQALLARMSAGHLMIDPRLLAGAKVYVYPQIYQQTTHQAGNGEVMTYLRNPAAWQKKLLAQHAYELGLPQVRIVLADGTRIRAWAVPPTPAGVTRYHYFDDPPPPGFQSHTWFSAGYMWQIQAPAGQP